MRVFFDPRKAVMATLVLAGSALAYLGSAELAAEIHRQPTGPDAFLNFQVDSTDELVAVLKKNPALRKRYARHFKVPEDRVIAFVKYALIPSRLPADHTTTVYGVTKSGSIYPVRHILKKGTKVWATRSAVAILKWQCANPVTTELPGTRLLGEPRSAGSSTGMQGGLVRTAGLNTEFLYSEGRDISNVRSASDLNTVGVPGGSGGGPGMPPGSGGVYAASLAQPEIPQVFTPPVLLSGDASAGPGLGSVGGPSGFSVPPDGLVNDAASSVIAAASNLIPTTYVVWQLGNDSPGLAATPPIAQSIAVPEPGSAWLIFAAAAPLGLPILVRRLKNPRV